MCKDVGPREDGLENKGLPVKAHAPSTLSENRRICLAMVLFNSGCCSRWSDGRSSNNKNWKFDDDVMGVMMGAFARLMCGGWLGWG